MKRQFIRGGAGVPPAVALINPKYGHNAAAALRACACFGIRQLWITGERAISEWEARGREPREERMKDYEGVQVCLGDYVFDAFEDTTVVGVEVVRSAQPLTTFQHPQRALYVFGPEDGSLSKPQRMACHQFVIIPSDHCLNLAVAVGIVLAHRRMFFQAKGGEPIRPSYQTMQEQRGFADSDAPLRWATT